MRSAARRKYLGNERYLDQNVGSEANMIEPKCWPRPSGHLPNPCLTRIGERTVQQPLVISSRSDRESTPVDLVSMSANIQDVRVWKRRRRRSVRRSSLSESTPNRWDLSCGVPRSPQQSSHKSMQSIHASIGIGSRPASSISCRSRGRRTWYMCTASGSVSRSPMI